MVIINLNDQRLRKIDQLRVWEAIWSSGSSLASKKRYSNRNIIEPRTRVSGGGESIDFLFDLKIFNFFLFLVPNFGSSSTLLSENVIIHRRWCRNRIDQKNDQNHWWDMESKIDYNFFFFGFLFGFEINPR